MSLVQIEWRPDAKRLREFGIAMLLGGGLLGGLLWLGWFPFATPQPVAAGVVWIVGGVCFLLGLALPRAALPLYWVWMALAFVLGSVLSRVLLVLVFFLLFTPMALVGRAFGRDRLRLRKSGEPSYWREIPYGRTPDPRRYQRQS
jgi:hypothetical protein